MQVGIRSKGAAWGYSASICSAISSNFTTLFQFRPVPETRNVFGIVAHESVGRPIPFGK